MTTTDENAAIDSIVPVAANGLSDDAVIEEYERGMREHAHDGRWVRMNFVTSADGSATVDGLSGGLSDAADKRLFALLRRVCDVIVVGAGTVRVEGYEGVSVDSASEEWRLAHGFAAQPSVAIVSGALELDPASEAFTKAPARPIVLTCGASPEARRARLAEVADVIVCGEASFDTAAALDALAGRGMRRVHCEGGPHLFGTFVRQGTLDELCLTVSPMLEGGTGRRIIAGSDQTRRLQLDQVLRSGDTLLLRYLLRR